MAILELLHYPDERLRTVAQPIREVDDRIRSIASDMAETMYAAPGIGLAATQVNIHERMILKSSNQARKKNFFKKAACQFPEFSTTLNDPTASVFGL